MDLGESKKIISVLKEWAGTNSEAFRVWGTPSHEHLDLAVHRDNITDVIYLLYKHNMPKIVLIHNLKKYNKL